MWGNDLKKLAEALFAGARSHLKAYARCNRAEKRRPAFKQNILICKKTFPI